MERGKFTASRKKERKKESFRESGDSDQASILILGEEFSWGMIINKVGSN